MKRESVSRGAIAVTEYPPPPGFPVCPHHWKLWLEGFEKRHPKHVILGRRETFSEFEDGETTMISRLVTEVRWKKKSFAIFQAELSIFLGVSPTALRQMIQGTWKDTFDDLMDGTET